MSAPSLAITFQCDSPFHRSPELFTSSAQQHLALMTARKALAPNGMGDREVGPAMEVELEGKVGELDGSYIFKLGGKEDIGQADVKEAVEMLKSCKGVEAVQALEKKQRAKR